MAETATLTLSDFLLARIAEDEAVLNEAVARYSPTPGTELSTFLGDWGDDERWIIDYPLGRALAECEAKRRIVEWCSERTRIWVGTLVDDPTDPAKYMPGDYAHKEDAPVLRLLAAPYATHPDFRPEWRS